MELRGNMKTRKRLCWIVLAGFGAFMASLAFGQQTIAPFRTQQANTDYFVGQGNYSSIQAAVTAACASAAAGGRVVIGAGITPPDTIAAATGGCTKSSVYDYRTIPNGCYTWGGSVYASVGCSSGSGYFSGTPTAGVSGAWGNKYVAVGNSSSTSVPRQLTQDDILPGFAIDGFSCAVCGNVEIGFTTSNPATFAASYSQTPASALISDGSHVIVLNSPFTSGSLPFAYVQTSQASQTFTLTAVGATTQTAQQSVNWLPRTFAGVGTPGATSANSSGTSAVLVGATGTLEDQGLGDTFVGQTFSASPSGQVIYLLLTGAGHTFTINGFTTAFSQSSISFVNQFGDAITMTLCASPTTLTGTYTIAVTN